MFVPDMPNPPVAPSITSAFSGFMLSTSVSTGTLVGVGGGVFSDVLASGVFIGMLELGGRKATGYFSSGRAWPAGIGATISGVTITINSVSFLLRVIDWKSLPR